MFAYVYILANKPKGVLYTGVTSDLVKRIYQHKKGLVPGFTERYNVKRLVYFEGHEDIIAAIKREKLIKRWRREWKFNLIEKENLYWNCLSIDYQIASQKR